MCNPKMSKYYLNTYYSSLIKRKFTILMIIATVYETEHTQIALLFFENQGFLSGRWGRLFTKNIYMQLNLNLEICRRGKTTKI